MRAIGTFLLVLLVPGCAESVPARDQQADLDNVALCFHEAVTVLQAEPETPDHLATFMRNAKAAVDTSSRDSTGADFDALRWSSDGSSLITTSGEPIRCRLAQRTHDYHGPDGSDWFMEYEFYVPDSDYISRTTIQLSMPE